MKYVNFNGKIHQPLYKYFGNLDYAENAILTNTIHFEKPSGYNDIFDSAMPLNEEWLANVHGHLDSSINFVANALPQDLRHFFSESNVRKRCIEKFQLKTMDYTLLNVIEVVSDVMGKEYPGIYNYLVDRVASMSAKLEGNDSRCENIFQDPGIKVSCFSETNTSLLMWAYYANNYRGVCLEYDFENVDVSYKDVVNSLHKVQYSDIRDYAGYYFKKSRQWEHEQEWRIATRSDEEYVEFPFLKAIYLGAKLDYKKRRELCELAIAKNLRAYFMIPDRSRYELSFMEVDDKR